jgi:succinyl-diaminopimelate desuccinylase
MSSEILDLTVELCKRASVTPNDAGCQRILAERLKLSGFKCESIPFGKVDNLWSTHGAGGPVFIFLGHTDVVPSGPIESWTTPPFEPTVADGMLRARGAADMKGSVAAMVWALERFVRQYPEHKGTLALLLTSDEEGDAHDGIRRVAETLQQRGQSLTWCLVGEPSSKRDLGDVIRVGRRGSLHGHLQVRGVQGHVAYPQLVVNPIHMLAPALHELANCEWDRGNEHFPPTTFQVSNIRAGTGAMNVVPGDLWLDFNFRFGTASNSEELMQRVEAILVKHNLDYRINWELSGAPFATAPGLLTGAVKSAVKHIVGIEPVADTGGGTSDGRFIAPLGAQVVELGPVNTSIHKVDECVAIADLDALGRIYLNILERLYN